MKLIHIKLKNGEDLIGQLVSSDDTTVTVQAPISVQINPERGIMGKAWLFLSDTKSISINRSETFLVSDASDRAYEYYEEFTYSVYAEEPTNADELEDSVNELEDMFRSMLESKLSTKH